MRQAVCAVCGTEASKYTCPYCEAASCSLACFQKHKANSACATARAAHERREMLGVPSSLLARGARDPSRFVAMRDYDYNQMIQDYQFLNQVGRAVTARGRSLADARMLPEQGRGPGPARRMPAAQQRREQLSKQIGFRKLPIMLLPDGMSKCQQNKTHWDAKKKRVLYTVQCTFPCADEAEANLRMHGQLGDATLGSCLGAAWSTSDAHGGTLDAKRPRLNLPSDTTTLGLDRDPHHTQWLTPCSTMQLLLRVYPLRLRNETTIRFLDWWSRKGASLHAVTDAPRPPRREPLISQHVLDKVARLHGTDAPWADEALSWSSTALYVSVPSTLSIDQVLRSLPDDHGIVEFLELEVWPKDVFAASERRGRAQLLQLTSTPRAVPEAVRGATQTSSDDAAAVGGAPARASAMPVLGNGPSKDGAFASEAAPVPAAPETSAAPPGPAALACPAAPVPAAAPSTLVTYASSDSE